MSFEQTVVPKIDKHFEKPDDKSMDDLNVFIKSWVNASADIASAIGTVNNYLQKYAKEYTLENGIESKPTGGSRRTRRTRRTRRSTQRKIKRSAIFRYRR